MKNQNINQEGKVEKMWYLSKLLAVTITSFNFFNCPVKSKFNHDSTDHGYLRSDAWKALKNFKIKRAQEARETQFVFQNNEILRSSKCLKTWTKWNLIQRVIRIKFNCGVYYICFRLKIATLFVKFGPKNRNCQFMLEIGT